MNKFKPGDTVRHISGKPFRGYGIEAEITKYEPHGQCYLIGQYGYNEENLVLVKRKETEEIKGR